LEEKLLLIAMPEFYETRPLTGLQRARIAERLAFLERGRRKAIAARIAEHCKQIKILQGEPGFWPGVLSSLG
jgi:hypothetical protein